MAKLPENHFILKTLFYKNHVYILAFSLFSLTILPRLMSYGMFLDGVVYAALSNNLANGIGELWKPIYTYTLHNPFYEHPPLAFWMQSFLYYILGDSRFIESFYGYFWSILTIIVMVHIFHLVYDNKSSQNQSQRKSSVAAFAIIAFCTIPKVSWMYAHNMLEIPLGFFTTLSVYFSLMSMKANHKKSHLGFGFLSGVAIGLAFLVKGPVGLFPLASSFLFYFLISKERDRFGLFLSYFGTLLALAAFSVLIISHDAAYTNITQYLKQQVFASLSGARKNAERWFIFQRLFAELLPPALVFYVISYFLRKKSKIKMSKPFLFFLLLAISASFPIVLSDKQTSWYLFPSYPFYALAITLLFVDPVSQLIVWLDDKLSRKKMTLALSGAIFLIAILSMILDKNNIRRNQYYYKDFIMQKLDIPEKQVISTCPTNLIHAWGLAARMMRDHKASLTKEAGKEFLLVQNHKNCLISESCKKYHPETSHEYTLYKCR